MFICKVLFTFTQPNFTGMKTLNLLPNRYKLIGWVLFIPSLLFGILLLTGMHTDTHNMIEIPVLYNSGLGFHKSGTGFFTDTGFFKMANVDWRFNLAGMMIITGGLLIGFSKEKQEDEYIAALRLKSVFWSLGISYLLLLISFLTVFGLKFLYLLIIAIYLPLILYIFKFHLLLRHEK